MSNEGFYRLRRIDKGDYIVLWWDGQSYLTSSQGMQYLGPVKEPTPLKVIET